VRNMGVIDLEALDVEVVELPPEEWLRVLDERAQELLGMSGEQFLAAVRAGEEFDHPAADRLEVLARTLIEQA
jgi:hypothetical protein